MCSNVYICMIRYGLGLRLATDRYRQTGLFGTGTRTGTESALLNLSPKLILPEPEYRTFYLIRTGPLVIDVKSGWTGMIPKVYQKRSRSW